MPASEKRLTPAMQQYARFKAAHPDCVLFFRMGDFYEMFEDDAVTAHQALGITLTQRSEGVPMAGVPHHAVENYLRRMIEQGHRVAVCDQIQDPKEAKGVVDRAVTRVLTPGTLVDDGLLDEGAANQVAALHLTAADPPAGVLAVAEVSTGGFTLHDLPADRLIDALARAAPSELLYAEPDRGEPPAIIERIRTGLGVSLTPRPAWHFRDVDAGDLLRDHYGVGTLKGFGLDDGDPAVPAAGALLRYLLETQAPGAESGADRLRHLEPPKRRRAQAILSIDATSLRSLEIERTIRGGQVEGSLLWVLQRCRTPMGKRRLRQWLCFPSADLDVITARQDAVAHGVHDPAFTETLREELGGVQDVARIAGRICMNRANPRDVVALGTSLERLERVTAALDGRPAFRAFAETLDAVGQRLRPLGETIRARCVETPPAHLREGGLFRDGIDEGLDEARMLQRDANQWLAAYQQRLIEATDIGSLKVGFNKVFGYYIEVTHAHTAKVPDAFTRKQTLKNAERYITPELKTFEEKVTTAEERAVAREKALFEALCAEAAVLSDDLRHAADLLADLDVLGGFADVALRHGYCRPTVVPEATLQIDQGRHPVLDRILRDGFVPNDCALDAGNTLAIITGPNMAGKSTYIRQVALLVLMAHTGGFVPAASATIGLTDRIFTRIGASDELHAGQSTFMVEMTETANILHHATDRSLVILDEIGRGTSTLDGLSLAWAIAESIAERRCRTLFATHYHELTSLAERLDNVSNLHVSVREWGEEVIFLYRILPGRTGRSYGIHVAKIAGLPPRTVQRAQELLDTLEVQTEPAKILGETPPPAGQLDLFREYLPHPAIEELKTIDLAALSPLQAFDALRRLVEGVEDDAEAREAR